jgi:hypothetical protein
MRHRFQVGETVAAQAFGVPAGLYQIRRLMPLSDGGVPQYRVVSVIDRHERAVAETAIRTLPARPPNESSTELPIGKELGPTRRSVIRRAR